MDHKAAMRTYLGPLPKPRASVFSLPTVNVLHWHQHKFGYVKEGSRGQRSD